MGKTFHITGKGYVSDAYHSEVVLGPKFFFFLRRRGQGFLKVWYESYI